jgi:hypothetical protein
MEDVMAPRQRFIHPDIWADTSFGKLQPVERVFFIGCFSNADDHGRLLGDPGYLRSTIFPYDGMTVNRMRKVRDATVDNCRSLVLYNHEGIEYLAFLKWTDYQKPKYPKPSKLPPPFRNVSSKLSEGLEEGFPPRLGREGKDWVREGLGS